MAGTNAEKGVYPMTQTTSFTYEHVEKTLFFITVALVPHSLYLFFFSEVSLNFFQSFALGLGQEYEDEDRSDERDH